MKKVTFSVFTMSYNKQKYVIETIKSVLNQTFTDFEYWVIENSTDKKTRQLVLEIAKTDKRIMYVERDYSRIENRMIVPALILNEYYPKANGDYILCLSDDDVFSSNCLQVIADFMRSNPCDTAYFKAKVETLINGKFEETNLLPVTGVRKHGELDCSVDGEQTVHTKDIMERLKKPYFSEKPDEAIHIDGLFIERLAALSPFQPIETEEFLLTKRRTPVSTFTKP